MIIKSKGSGQMKVDFIAAEMKDAEILRDIAIQAFEDDRRKYGSLPPGIDSLN